MKKWTLAATALTEDGKTISLQEHDGSYSIQVDGSTLMTTRQHSSEERLAELACARLKGKQSARVLIGGLGFGFTLRAALAALAPEAAVVVAEILAPVIDWNRNPSFHLAATDLRDPRVTLVHRDVWEVIRDTSAGFDSIMMDVDNGPAPLSTEGNSKLYDYSGLQSVRAALRPEGCVAFWSAAPDAAFERLMARAGFLVDVQSCRSHSGAGRRHTIFLGRVK